MSHLSESIELPSPLFLATGVEISLFPEVGGSDRFCEKESVVAIIPKSGFAKQPFFGLG